MRIGIVNDGLLAVEGLRRVLVRSGKQMSLKPEVSSLKTLASLAAALGAAREVLALDKIGPRLTNMFRLK